MNDLELTKKCAEAMGWTVSPYEAGGPRHFGVWDKGQMIYGIGEGFLHVQWKPLHDDGQAMALACRLLSNGELSVTKRHFSYRRDGELFREFFRRDYYDNDGHAPAQFRRAICECVAALRSPEGE